MLWKILSGLAAIALAAGVWFSLQLKKSLQSERDMAKRETADLDTAKKKLATGAEKKTFWEKELAGLQKQKEDVAAQLEKARSDKTQKEAEVTIIKNDYDKATKQVADLQKQINDAGDIQKLLVKVDELKKQETAADAAVANEQQKLALAAVRVDKINADLTRVEEAEKHQRSGIVEPDFTARISQPYQSFGFVILNKGNLAGMFANAMLDVKRGNRVVAKLKVRDVEQA